MSLVEKVKEWLCLRYEVYRFHFLEERKVKALYNNSLFFQVDKALKRSYIFLNPFSICRQFYEYLGFEDGCVYGETPLSEIKHILETLPLSKETRVCDLGCGRGRLCFFLSSYLGLDTTGVEWVEEFVSRAHKIKDRYQLPNLQFVQRDLTEFGLQEFDLVFVFSILFDEKTTQGLYNQLNKMREGSFVMTISEPLPIKGFSVVREETLTYPWGVTTGYVHRKER